MRRVYVISDIEMNSEKRHNYLSIHFLNWFYHCLKMRYVNSIHEQSY